MRRLVLIFTLALITIPSTPAQLQTGGIEGVVVASETGKPISNARVQIYNESNQSASAVSDAIGRFLFTNLRPARYRIYASHDLFQPNDRRGESVVTLPSGGNVRDVRVELDATGTISGRILDENRSPQAGVYVQALRYSYPYGRRVLTVGYTATTDDKGDYRLSGLVPGKYFVRATPRQPQWARPTYHPLLADPKSAILVSVEPGSETGGIDIELDSTIKTYPVRLKLAGMPLEPRRERSVHISVIQNGDLFDVLRVDIERLGANDFRLHRLPVGNFEIWVVVEATGADRPLNGFMHAEIRDTPGSEIDLGLITLRESVAIIARVEPPSSFLVHPNSPLNDVRADAIEGPSAFGPWGGRINDRGPEGKTAAFYVPLLGRYVFSMYLPRDTFLTAIGYAGRDILGTGLLLDGEPDGPLDFILGGPESVGYVTGVVRDAKFDPVARSKVILIPDEARRSNPYLFGVASTDPSGAFVIENVLPGDYTLFAWEEVERNAWFDPEFLKDYERFGAKITIRAGVGSTQDLQIIGSR